MNPIPGTVEHTSNGTVRTAGPIRTAIRRLVKTLMLIVILGGGAVFGLYKMHVEIPALHTTKLYAQMDILVARAEVMKGRAVGLYEKYFHKNEEEVHHEPHKIVVTSPQAKAVTITQEYVCQIHSRRHISIRALEDGYLEAIPIREGQAVKKGDLMFKVRPILYEARLAAEVAERNFVRMELENTRQLFGRQGVSEKEVKLFEAKLAKAQAKVDLAEAELNFATVRAPFDGIVDRLIEQEGSLVKEGDPLTTLSDNSVMWVYFNVPEARYLEYMAELGQNKDSTKIELELANHLSFPQDGKIGAIEANFNNETGNIAFRADFPNPDSLLRHGQTGKVKINRILNDAIVIPQRATFENLAKRYVYIVDKDDVVHQQEIVIQNELEDLYVLKSGPSVKDHIIVEVEAEFRSPEQIIANLKYKAE
jgi:membrane fusion protein (multidrug efflux system)